jgi:hypothetical protein
MISDYKAHFTVLPSGFNENHTIDETTLEESCDNFMDQIILNARPKKSSRGRGRSR